MKHFTILFLTFLAAINISLSQPTWVHLNPGTTNTLNSVFFLDINTGYAVGNSGTICKTTNGGAQWQLIQLNTGYQLNSIWFSNAFSGYAAGSYSTGSQVFALMLATTDGGLTWNATTTGNSDGDMYLYSVSSFQNTNTAIAVGYFIDYVNTEFYSLFSKTTNAGLTWNSVTDSIHISILRSVQMITPLLVYSVGSNSMILKSTDGASTWASQSPGITIPFNTVFFVDGNNGYVGGDLGKMVKTTDGGNTWTNISLPGSPQNAIKSLFFPLGNPVVGYHSTDLGNIRETTDAGLDWANQTTNTQASLNSIYFIGNGDLLTGYSAGSNGSLLKWTNLNSIKQISSNIPKSFEIKQNYPNPFNPTTKIKFDIPSSDNQNVKLTVYDVLGREVALLVNGLLTPGNYVVSFDASGLASGVYFYRIEAGTFAETKKMILTK